MNEEITELKEYRIHPKAGRWMIVAILFSMGLSFYSKSAGWGPFTQTLIMFPGLFCISILTGMSMRLWTKNSRQQSDNMTIEEFDRIGFGGEMYAKHEGHMKFIVSCDNKEKLYGLIDDKPDNGKVDWELVRWVRCESVELVEQNGTIL